MSFFPSPDPHKLRTVFAHNSQLYAQTPPTPAHSHHSPGDHSLPSSAVEAAFSRDSSSVTWQSQSHEPRGLGLTPISASGSAMEFNHPPSAVILENMPFTWPSQLRSTHSASTGAGPTRKDSWGDGCDPMSTLLPAVPTWDQSIMTQTGYQSPVRSDYSASTQASCISSPYPFSDLLLRTAVSPSVKVETPAEFLPGQLQYIPESAAFNQPLLVRPGDLVTHPPSVSNQAAMSDAVDMNQMDMDCKPDFSSLRPSNRRTASSEDCRSLDLDGRAKRSFTKPETASCHCDHCGKLFQRSYNLKAHLETHDPNRDHPHECDYSDCDKRFVRRTDLVRHEQSVHLKMRNYQCHMCDSSFARKDTLRRHVDDGCPRRAEFKKRIGKTRRPSTASSSRRPSYQSLAGQSPIASPLRQPVEYF